MNDLGADRIGRGEAGAGAKEDGDGKTGRRER